MKLSITVQSVSDIITNSSSEAFIRTSYDGVEIIYDIIDSILKSLGIEVPKSTDMFEITKLDDCYEIKPLYPEYSEVAKTLEGINDLFYADGYYGG